ncbi:MAG: hypothetical protein HRT47_09965 [Candidatus Caenarcaniphilales bacterium]|nr:hypothetical protein [Candidatus Caenarcaniphilales bacterium]
MKTNNQREDFNRDLSSPDAGPCFHDNNLHSPDGSLKSAASTLTKLLNFRTQIQRSNMSEEQKAKELSFFQSQYLKSKVSQMVNKVSVKQEPGKKIEGNLDLYGLEDMVTEQLIDLKMYKLAASRLVEAINTGPFFSITNAHLLDNLTTVFAASKSFNHPENKSVEQIFRTLTSEVITRLENDNFNDYDLENLTNDIGRRAVIQDMKWFVNNGVNNLLGDIELHNKLVASRLADSQ